MDPLYLFISASSCCCLLVIIAVIVILLIPRGTTTTNNTEEDEETTTTTTTTAKPSCSSSSSTYTTAKDVLLKTEKLDECHGLMSKDGKTKMVVQTDGRLVTYKNNEVFWKSSEDTFLNPPYTLSFTEEGELKLIDKDSNSVWTSVTADSKADTVILHNNGYLVMYKGKTAEVVKTFPSLEDTHTCTDSPSNGKYIPRLNYLVPGDVLKQCEALISEDKKVSLVVQSDGKLKIFNEDTEIWTAPITTSGVGPYALAYQNSDKNIVLYDKTGKALWASNTAGQDSTGIYLQNDKNLVVYNTETAVRRIN